MTEEIKKSEETTPEPIGEIQDTNTKEEGKFTQAQVNQFVQTRLAKEKETSKKLSEDFEAMKEQYEQTIKGYEGIVADIIKEKTTDLPPQYAKLLESLPLAEQYKFLNCEEKTLAPKKAVPSSPVPSGKEGITIVPAKQEKYF